MLIDWLERHMMPCFYSKYLGVECPGCGFQRAFIALLKGEIAESLAIFPALIPTLGMFIFLVVHLFMKFKNGGTILKYLFIFNITILVFHYIYKIIY
ncbi:MAG: DUF2752 domain-containing protein [Bacteroidota bacterium]